jgi:hypothetical protein
LRELLERAFRSPEPAPLADLDDLVGAAEPHVQEWLARKAANADGIRTGVVVASSTTVASLLELARQAEPDRVLHVTRQRRPLWSVLESGLLHGVCGLTMQQIADRRGLVLSSVHAEVKTHRRALRDSSEYLATASKIVRVSLDRDFGGLRPRDM